MTASWRGLPGLAAACGFFAIAALHPMISWAGAGDDMTVVGESGRPVVVMHDWFGDSSNYDPVLPYLDRQAYTYLFVDLPGYGSRKAERELASLDAVSAYVLALADARGWDRFDLVGHSMSGLLAQAVAVAAPGRVRSLSLVAPVGPEGSPMDEAAFGALLRTVTDRTAAAGVLDALSGGGSPPGWLRFKTGQSMESASPAARRAYLSHVRSGDLRERAKGLAVPVHVIAGRRDLPAFQPDALKAAFAPVYPSLAISVIDSAGHYPMQQTPVPFVQVLEGFLGTVPR